MAGEYPGEFPQTFPLERWAGEYPRDTPEHTLGNASPDTLFLGGFWGVFPGRSFRLIDPVFSDLDFD